MASLKQNIKNVLTDVEKFLAETLKSVKLDKSSKDGKEKLLERVRQLLEEMFGGSNSNSTLDSERYASGGSFNQASGGGSSTSGESSSNLQATADDSTGYSDEISKIAVNDLKDVFQAGLLDRKKKSGLKSWEQMYCVVSRNIFYMYKKQTDAKQKEAFCLTGYEFQEAPGLEKDSSKKEMCFELTKAGSLAFQFRAGSKDAMLIWKEAIQKGIQASPDIQITPDDEDGEGEVFDEMYEDLSAYENPPSYENLATKANNNNKTTAPPKSAAAARASTTYENTQKNLYENSGSEYYENAHLDGVPAEFAPPPPVPSTLPPNCAKNAKSARNFFTSGGTSVDESKPKNFGSPASKVDVKGSGARSPTSPTAKSPTSPTGVKYGPSDFGSTTNTTATVRPGSAARRDAAPPPIDIFKDCNSDELYDDATEVPNRRSSVRDLIAAEKKTTPVATGGLKGSHSGFNKGGNSAGATKGSDSAVQGSRSAMSLPRQTSATSRPMSMNPNQGRTLPPPPPAAEPAKGRPVSTATGVKDVAKENTKQESPTPAANVKDLRKMFQ